MVNHTSRIQSLFLGFLAVLLLIIIRLAYWQLIRGDELRVKAHQQYTSTQTLNPKRGEILSADGFPLVYNQPIYNLTAYTPHLEISPREVANKVIPLLEFDLNTPEYATNPAHKQARLKELRDIQRGIIIDRLTTKDYAVLAKSLSLEQKSALSALSISGLNFEEGYKRGYAEASMSAHLLGFVGRNDLGEPTGYFGLEGYYDRELKGKVGYTSGEVDAHGNPLIIGDYHSLKEREGRNLVLNIERSVQFQVETALKQAIQFYGASAGEVVVMDPYTGAILAMASYPNYDPANFYQFPAKLYKNPVIANSYEPGSTFKVLTMASALEEKAIKLDDQCDICDGPVTIDKYTIKTWNNKYTPNSTPETILVHSDNVGMVWIVRKLGGEKFVKYLHNLGFGQLTNIDLQEETTPKFRDHWGAVEYATASFGQGIAVTSIQLVRAVASIANGGLLVEPHVVAKVIGDKELPIKPKIVRRVFSPETTKKMTQLMIASAEHGDAKWTRLPDYVVAGKTGTAQIPINGRYDPNKTIASFIGFAPADKPRFVMLVKLREPTTSIWGSETAAPLWFSLAKKLLIHYNIPPNSH